MTKLHITTKVNFGYKPKDTGLNITDENTVHYGCNGCNGAMYDGCSICERGDGDWLYKPGIVKAFTNYTGVLLANGRHITLHYGDTTTLPDGLFFEMPVLIKILGKSTSKAGECLIVEVIIPNHESITEQI